MSQNLRPKISCIVHTYNSEAFLAQCLQSVKWVDELIVVDMMSTDRTKDIAQQNGAQVFTVKNVGYADPARAFGQAQCKGDWILSIDSDEVMPKALAEKLQSVVTENQIDVAYLCFRNFFFGKEVKHTSWSYRHIYVPRFYRRGFISYGEQVHNFIHVKPEARKVYLIAKDLAILHLSYKSIRHFIDKLNSYTDAEAEKAKFKGPLLFHLIYQALREFGGRYILRLGFLDGWLGFYLSKAMVFYRWSALMKQITPKEDEVVKIYQSIGDRSNRGEIL